MNRFVFQTKGFENTTANCRQSFEFQTGEFMETFNIIIEAILKLFQIITLKSIENLLKQTGINRNF